MPEDNCPKITFYAPSSKLGGDKPIPSCVPPVVKVPEVLYKPEGTEESEIPLNLPRPIELINTAQTATCETVGKTGSEGAAVTVPAGDFQALLVFDSVPGIDRDVLDYIASNNYEDDIEQLLRDGLLTSEYLTKLGLTKSQADEFLKLAADTIDMLNKSALALASSMLECYWYNREVTATCPDDAARDNEHADARWSYTVEAGTIKSLISQADADKQAKIIAETSINCIYLSDPVAADCVTRPDAPAEDLKPVPNDEEPVYEGLIPRKGSVALPRGAVVSDISKSDATAQAQATAYSMLVCYYINDKVIEQCTTADGRFDADARNQGVNPATSPSITITVPSKGQTGQTIVVPQGYVTSELSTALATEEARVLAKSLLECCYINQEITAECDVAVSAYDPNDIQTAEANEKNIVTVPTGTIIGCTSQDEVDKQAKELAESMLECSYCNKLIKPTCVPDWVVTAATEGIKLTKAASIPVLVGNHYQYLQYNEGDIYRIKLPLDQEIYYNPVKDIEESITMWSEDATVGAPEGYQCLPDYDQANQVAEAIASTNLHLLLQADSNDTCTYTNDLLIAGCNFSDPYGGTPTSASNTYKIQYYRSTIPASGEVYYLYRHNVDPLLRNGVYGRDYQGIDLKALSSPALDTYVSIPAGTISITKDDVPSDYKPTGISTESYEENTDDQGNPIDPETGIIAYPGLAADISETQRIKAYANDLALEMAKGMIECNYTNYLLTAGCSYGAIDPRPLDLQSSSSSGAVTWDVAAGSFVGKKFKTVMDAAEAALGTGPVCLVPNDEWRCSDNCKACEELEDLPTVTPQWSNPLMGNGVIIPAGSFYADTKENANALVFNMCAQLQSVSECVYTVDEAEVDCGASCASLGFGGSAILDDDIILNTDATSSISMTASLSASSTGDCKGIAGALTALCSAKCAAVAAMAYTNAEITYSCISSHKTVTLPKGTFVGSAESVKGLIEIWKTSACGETISLIAGDNIHIVYQNNTYTISVSPIPGETISLIAGDNIAITNSGNTYTISCKVSSVPGDTISLVAGDNIAITNSENTYTISCTLSPIPNETISLIAGDHIHIDQKDNTYTISVSPVPSTNISLVEGDNIKIDKNDDTYTISCTLSPVPSETISLIPGTGIDISGTASSGYTISCTVSPIQGALPELTEGTGIDITGSASTGYTITCTLSNIQYDFDSTWFEVNNNTVSIRQTKLEAVAQSIAPTISSKISTSATASIAQVDDCGTAGDITLTITTTGDTATAQAATEWS